MVATGTPLARLNAEIRIAPPRTGLDKGVALPHATRPNALIALVYLGAAVLAVGAITLGVGLLR